MASRTREVVADPRTLVAGDAGRIATASAAVGGLVVWVPLVAVDAFGAVDDLILLAALALVPLAMGLLAPGDVDGGSPALYRVAVVLQPAGAVGFVGAVALGEGPLAAAALVPWLATIGCMALFGASRFRARGPGPVHELLVDAGLVYGVVGAGSYLFHLLGIDLGFPPSIIHLTAAHFHYAGILLPVVAGVGGRVVADGLPRRAYRVGALTVIGGMPVVALGITLSRLAALRTAELVGAALFAAGTVALAAVLLGVAVAPGRVADRPIPGTARVPLAIAAVAITVTMVLAATYGYSRAFDPGLLSISTMVRYHGVTNALGFALPGLLAWHAAGPPAGRGDPDDE